MTQKAQHQNVWRIKALYQDGTVITVVENSLSEARRKINYKAAIFNTKIQAVTGKRMSVEGRAYGSN